MMKLVRELKAVVAIRLAYWLGVALSLLWAPLHGSAISPFRAYDALSDLVFSAFARWDSVWFIHIADHGYDSKQVTAFFPVYPLLVRVLSHVVGSTVVAGCLVSLVAGSIGVAVVHRIARLYAGADAAWDTALLIALYPLAFVFTAVYSDGLFLALSAGAYLAAAQRRPVAAGVLGALAVGTRLIGLALLPALALLLWPRTRRELLNLVPLILLPLALGAYALYLQHHLGDALAFSRAQGTYWNRHVSAVGPLGGAWDGLSAGYHGALELLRHLPRGSGAPDGFPARDQWAAWNVVQLLLLVAACGLTVVAWRIAVPLGVYSLATILIFLSSPADFVPLVSTPRFLLSDFPLFIALAVYTRRHAGARTAILCTFAAVGCVAAVAFSRAVWVA